MRYARLSAIGGPCGVAYRKLELGTRIGSILIEWTHVVGAEKVYCRAVAPGGVGLVNLAASMGTFGCTDVKVIVD